MTATSTTFADDLPSIGDSAEIVLPPEQAEYIGRQTLRSIRQAGLLVEDEEMSDYIQNLGHFLASFSPDPASQFTFFLLDDPSINAFALPGGFIGVHTGLLTATDNEGELAAVIAHEIAHVTQHHLARRFAKQQDLQGPLNAALLAAIILAGQNPALAQAALASTIAGSQQAALDFTREHEREADRIGINMLTSAGFSGKNMAQFFNKLYTEYQFAGQVPEFLSTHPVTESRIADAMHRADLKPATTTWTDTRYGFVKARLQIRNETSPQTSSVILPTGDSKVLEQYRRAFDQLHAGDRDNARATIDRLLAANPYSLAIINAAGIIHRRTGDLEKAESIYREGLQRYPDNSILVVELARILHDSEQFESLERFIDLRLLNKINKAYLYKLLAEAQAKLGKLAASHLSQAEYLARIDELSSAIDHLQNALRIGIESGYDEARAEALLNQLIRKKKLEEKLGL